MSKVNVGRNVSRCLSFFAAFYNFDWTTFGVAEKLDSSSQTSGFIVRNKWQVEQKTQNIFKSREHTLKTVLRHFEGCSDRFLSQNCVWYSLHPFAKTLNRGKSASITLLWNKSGQIAFFFFLADPFLGRCNLGCRGFWKKRRKSDWSATVLSRRRKKQRKKRTSPKRPIRSLYRRAHVMILGKVGWMTGGGEYKEG